MDDYEKEVARTAQELILTVDLHRVLGDRATPTDRAHLIHANDRYTQAQRLRNAKRGKKK